MKREKTRPRLRKCLDLGARETAQSYLSRLSLFFSCLSPKEFCADFGLDLKRIQNGEVDALKDLACLTGCDSEALIKWTPVRLSRSHMRLNGEILDNRTNARHVVRICPECAKLDIESNPGKDWDQAVYGRSEWTIGLVNRCAIHNVLLIARKGPQLDLLRLDVAGQTSELLANLRSAPSIAAKGDAFQEYILSRVGVGPMTSHPSPLLDSLPLCVVSQLCLAAGNDVLRQKQTSPAAAALRYEAGFAFLGRGEAHFEAQFIKLRGEYSLTTKASTIIGSIMEYLTVERTREEHLRRLVDLVADVCFRNLPYGAGDRLLDRVCRKRSLHDFNTARKAYGIGKHHLRAFIDGRPDLVVYRGRRHADALIRTEAADRIILSGMPYLNSAEVARQLGFVTTVPSKILDMLIRTGVLHPVLDPELPGHKLFFSAAHVREFMASVTARCRHLVEDDGDMIGLRKATLISALKYDQIWKMIADGELRSLGMRKGENFANGIYISLRELLFILSGEPNAMLSSEVMARLGVSDRCLRGLVAEGHLKTKDIRAEFDSRLQYVFDGGRVTQFHARYISLRNARSLTHWHTARKSFADLGIPPAIIITSSAQRGAHGIFFEREHLGSLS